MSDKQERFVFITDPEKFGTAIKTLQDELGSIELQEWYGDKITPATKSDFIELRNDIKSLREATAEQLQRIHLIVLRSEDRLNRILSSLEPITAWLLSDMEKDQAECACSSCGCGGWVDFVYENADIEDGVQAVVTGLADDSCDCDLCREVPYGRS